MKRNELKHFIWTLQDLQLHEIRRAIYLKFKVRVTILTIIEIKVECLEIKLKMLEDRIKHESKKSM